MTATPIYHQKDPNLYHSKDSASKRADRTTEAAERYIGIGWVIVKAHAPIFSTSGRVCCTCEEYKRSDAYRQWLADHGREQEYNPDFICPNPGKHPHGSWKDITEVMSVQKAVKLWGKVYKAVDVDTGQRVNIVWNIGVLTGPSDLLTLDADTYKEHYQCDLSELIPIDDQETPQQFTHGGGLHLVFCREGKPYSNSNGELKAAGIDGVDIRGGGGFQVVEPSLGPSGNEYAWVEGFEPWSVALRPIPADLDRLLATTAGKRSNPAQPVNFTTPTTNKPDLAQWGLSHKILDMLHNPPPVGKRSEADQKVITALIHHGATDDAILSFFEHFPLGTQGRFAEKGRDYLAYSIGKARQYVKDHPLVNDGGVDDMASNGFGKAPAVSLNMNGAAHVNGHSSATATQSTTQSTAPAGGKVPPIVDLLKAIDDAGTDAKSKMVAGKMPAGVRDALDAKIKSFDKEIANNAAHAVMIADAIQRAGGYVFDDALLFVQECILTAQMGKERAKGFAAIKVKTDKLRNMGHKFRLNLLEDNIEMDGQIVDDVARSELALYMAAHGIKKTETDDVLNVLAKEDAYHPVQCYLNGLKWDGKNHLDNFLAHIQVGGPTIIMNGAAVPLGHALITRWALSCVARGLDGDKPTAFKPQTPMLVFIGGQGMGKSSLVRWLASGIGYDFHQEGPMNPQSTEDKRSMVTKWIWEVSELGSSLRKADRDATKSFITQEWHTYRKPWGRVNITKPTLCNLVGSINAETGFLDDPTGNRRFFPVELTGINKDYKKAVDVDQLWAQLVYLYRSGVSPFLSDTESAALASVHKEHEVENPLSTYLEMYFDIAPGFGQCHTAVIIQRLQAFGVSLNNNPKVAGRDINDVLAPMGLTRKFLSIDGVKGWGWIGIAPNGKPLPQTAWRSPGNPEGMIQPKGEPTTGAEIADEAADEAADELGL